MGKESIVEIPKGSGNFYRYEYEGSKTLYKGPVGDSPAIGEEEFFAGITRVEDITQARPTGVIILPGWEGRTDDPYRKQAAEQGGLEFDTFEEAQRWLGRQTMFMPEGMLGYNKYDFIASWSDGEEYRGRIDLKKEHTSYDIGDHIKDHAMFMAGLKRPTHMEWAQYLDYLRVVEKREPGSKEMWKKFLEGRNFED
jgi:hypothetical protein